MKVSVLMITYNHEKFIAQAVESILMQETDFEYEIVIGEDCSTDDTRNIVLRFQEKYPDKIRLLLPSSNLGMNKNFISTFQACQGQYIALIEGDDYWTSPHKLQRQVNFLDNHPECAICFHSTRHFYEDGSREAYDSKSPNGKEFFTTEDLFLGNFIPTCSTMFRGEFFNKLPGWFYELYSSDLATQILISQHGKIGYINEVMGATRIHGGGAWNGVSRITQLERLIKQNKMMRDNLAIMQNSTVAGQISKFYFELAVEYMSQRNFEKARRCAVKSISELPINAPVSNINRLKLLAKVLILGLGINGVSK